MTEILFILTTIFVAYVVYAVVGDQIIEMRAMVTKSKTETESSVGVTRTDGSVQAVSQIPVAQVVMVDETSVQRPAAKAKVKKAASKSAPAAKVKPKSAVKSVLKDPASGEVANMPTNYRFAKRWIKEALVEEGLLDKVYKNNELDDKANTKIKRALNKLAKMEQYKA